MIAFLVSPIARVASVTPLRMFALRQCGHGTRGGRAVGGCAVRVVLHLGALYAALAELQRDAGGLAFLPANIIMAVFSLGLSAKLVMRFGIRAPLSLGLLVAAVGLVLFSRAPAAGNFVLDVLPGMVLMGLGRGWPSTRCCWPR